MAIFKNPDPLRPDPQVHSPHSSVADRERFIKPLLPEPRSQPTRSRSRKTRPKPIRTFLKNKLYYLAYFLIHICFSIYIRLRQSYHAVVDRVLAICYYHHRTPELIRKDVRDLGRLPEHLSVVLTMRKDEEGLEILMDEVAELVAWSSCVGIPMLSIYEKTGVLKPYIPALHQIITTKLSSYYGPPSQQPTLHLFAPHHPIYTPQPIPSAPAAPKTNLDTITVLLLSSTDGRDTLVDLTKTLAEMAQNGKISPQDISTILIDAELSDMMTTPTSPPPEGTEVEFSDTDETTVERESASSAPVMKAEPDLLLVFGPYVRLDGYPPWQIRLTEIFCTGDNSSSIMGDGGEAVEYQRFLRGLWKYAKAEFRFGR
ncbi:undecaprenyl pyrophosphate synthase [Emydomyces testavorans]|uniref:ditrans,polycis-polyprenyl diphosphate synthase [(2E,6E)-farnesyldiphosphate specific] n=1 Tax=Emydomyces testavorans TaxID=2070801 RepID=A0AAF0DJE4_9EURO|nr:undecaprenyl pyrophosphate synthase [Emydomyces testavorans]